MRETSEAYNVGFAVGLIFAVVVSAVVIVILKKFYWKQKGPQGQYDERQILIRGNAYKYTTYTYILGICVIMILDIFLDESISRVDMMLTLLFVGIAVDVIYCLWNDAYYTLSNNPKKFLILYAFVMVLNGGIAAMSYLHGQSYCINALCALLFLAIFITTFVKHLVSKVEE